MSMAQKIVDYREQRRSERRASCINCGISDDKCTDRVLSMREACCSLCYSTDTHPSTPEPETLHEIIFWEVRSGPTKDERQWADWLMNLSRERVLMHLVDPLADDSKVWNAAVDQVASEFTIPEGRGEADQ